MKLWKKIKSLAKKAKPIAQVLIKNAPIIAVLVSDAKSAVKKPKVEADPS